MKKLIHRILIIFFAAFFACYSSLFAFCNPVYAADIALTYELIEYAGSISPDATGLADFLSGLVQYEIVSGACHEDVFNPQGEFNYEGAGHLISTQLADKIVGDFAREIATDPLNVCLIQPAELSKSIFYDKPLEGINWLLEHSAAGAVVVGDSIANGYCYVSDSFRNRLAEFLGLHVIDGVYYSNVDDANTKIHELNHNAVYSCLDIPSNIVYTYTCNIVDGYQYGVISRDKKTISFGDTLSKQINSFFYTAVNGSYTTYSWYDNPGVGRCVGSNIPMFSANPDFTKSRWWEDADNWESVAYPDVLWPDNTGAAEHDWSIDRPWPISVGALEGIGELVDEKVGEYVGDLPIDVPIDIPIDTPIDYPIDFPIPIPWDDVINPPIDEPIDEPVEPEPITIPDQPEEDPELPDDSGGGFIFDLSEFFPFCLPMDLYLAMKMLSVDSSDEFYSYFENMDSENENNASNYSPVTFEVPVTFHLEGLNAENVDHNFVIDIVNPSQDNTKGAEPYVKYLRFFLLFLYIIFLIFATIKIIPR